MGTEPMPVGGRTNVMDYARRLIDKREAYGVAKYGQPLHTDDGRSDVDVEEEIFDKFIYELKVHLERRDALTRIVTRLLYLCPELTDEWLHSRVKPEAVVEYVVRKFAPLMLMFEVGTCGHNATVSDKEGTCYCLICERGEP